MRKNETGKIENDHTTRMLSDHELDAVSGGITIYDALITSVVARPSERGDFLVTS